MRRRVFTSLATFEISKIALVIASTLLASMALTTVLAYCDPHRTPCT